LKRAALSTAAGVAFPAIIPSHVLGAPGRPGANDRIQVGVIGVGFRANLLIDQLPKPGQVVALSDCFLSLAEAAVAKRKTKWDVYQDYRRLLDRKDIDAVIVATQDFDRVIPSIHACQAGKDVYAEKPLTLYPGEGTVLVKVARKYKTVFQVGTQQRSMEMDQMACKLVRTGGLGTLKLVQCLNYPDSKPFTTAPPEEPKPEKLDWETWTGQAPMRPYSSQLHSHWPSYQDYGGGETTNWGAHGLDMVQMALGMDDSGPVEFWPLAEPAGAVAFRYANGVEVRLEVSSDAENEHLQGGARFIGEKGKIDIWRNDFKIDAPGITLDLPPQEEIDKWHDKRALWQAQYHMGFWLECIPTRKKPNADVEIGHRSVSVCHLANLARRMNRKLRWDPKKEQVIGDKEANLLATNRPRRKGWELPKI
jgi:predicted dehydrogenase